MTTSAGVSYTFHGNFERVRYTSPKLYWYGLDGSVLAETDGSGNPVNEYIYFDGMRIARRDSSGNVYYSFSNELGSPTITTATGSICYDADFYPFGGEHAYTSTCAPNQKFAGMEQDSATGLYRTIFRQYASNNGRWLSPDPYAGSYDPSNPQSMNRYAYVMNGPMNWIDPWGLYEYCGGWCTGGILPCGRFESGANEDGSSGSDSGNGPGQPCQLLPTAVPVTMSPFGPQAIRPRAATGCNNPTGPQGGVNPGNGATNAPNNPAPKPPTCSQQASASANSAVPAVLPNNWEVADETFGSAVGLGIAIATAPDDGPLAGGTYRGVKFIVGGALAGLAKTAAFHAVAKAFVWGVVYSNCATPSSAPIFMAP
ncbi:MAG TPA: RHS repeat-associated core domain-containing protein [Terracidiphilus sp.]|nr:RHS repeat-associated core domain-containing protein [Terracidiphilus sp.]